MPFGVNLEDVYDEQSRRIRELEAALAKVTAERDEAATWIRRCLKHETINALLAEDADELLEHIAAGK
jgi:hypothetical protein